MGGEAFEQPEFVQFFTTERRRPEDLYPSERRFLGWLATRHGSVLDVGCGAGGFRDIWRAYAPDIAYQGIDRSAALIEAARRLRPADCFDVGDAAEGIDLPDHAADVVQALGWLHWEPRYPQALQELWRLAAKELFFDVRLLADADTDLQGLQRLPGGGATPYLAVAWPAFAEIVLSLKPERILAYGYEGPPSAGVEGMPPVVCFAAFCLQRGTENTPQACVDAPLPWPPAFTGVVEHIPAELLPELTPVPF